MSVSRDTNEEDRTDEISEIDEEACLQVSTAVHNRDAFRRFANIEFDRHFVVKLIDEGSEALSALGKAGQPKEPDVKKPAEHSSRTKSTQVEPNRETSGDTGLSLFNVFTSNIPRLYSVKDLGTSAFNVNGASRKSIPDGRSIQHECVRQPWSTIKTPVRRKSEFKTKTDDVVEPRTEDSGFKEGFWKPLERPLKSQKFKAGGDSITKAVAANSHLFATKTVQTELTSKRPTTTSLDFEVSNDTKNKPEPTSNAITTDIRPKTTGSMIPYPYFAKPGIGTPNRLGRTANFMALDSDYNAWRFGAQKTSEAQRSILSTCVQRQPIPVQLMVEYLLNVKKIGEGVYGEVYKGYHKGGTELRVFKIIPIEGSKLVNGEKQKKFHEIEPEIIVAQEVNKLRKGINGCQTDGHSKLIQAKICVGSYPAILTREWKAWHKIHGSQNDLPSFNENQLYAMLEFDFHGADVETFRFKNSKQSFAVLLNVVYTLAASEVGIQFEHRDLHWGNILVLRTRESASSYTIKGESYRVPNCGLKTTLIDYTISRVTNSANGESVFTDLANDEDQFCGSEEYQFEIYRMMREKNRNNWKPFCPKSNVFWIHYLAGKLVDKAIYQEATSGVHYYYKNKLLRIQAAILKYDSCWDCVQNFLGPFVKEIGHEG